MWQAARAEIPISSWPLMLIQMYIIIIYLHSMQKWTVKINTTKSNQIKLTFRSWFTSRVNFATEDYRLVRSSNRRVNNVSRGIPTSQAMTAVERAVNYYQMIALSITHWSIHLQVAISRGLFGQTYTCIYSTVSGVDRRRQTRTPALRCCVSECITCPASDQFTVRHTHRDSYIGCVTARMPIS